ncbi:carbamoyltransferase C-terminal domain-containing protein [Streptomyces sp. 8L]|uniref:carbamoyltransferase C-terminal domain-containing protein n=1 Tax=Streptomyces sp. 8L TaxID=2877242 RepID=UPI001CD5FA1D|nr:carbamoyltransferase C-terminal domain-containing protein [Streptomyces sp. 8L]MCA1223396.1 hypothetical protein [Streptomyces sp. 8L]
MSLFLTRYQQARGYEAEGRIIGWFQDGSELGLRALGARSILAAPRTTASSEALNSRIKHRKPFRPFVPAVLARYAPEWVEVNCLPD